MDDILQMFVVDFIDNNIAHIWKYIPFTSLLHCFIDSNSFVGFSYWHFPLQNHSSRTRQPASAELARQRRALLPRTNSHQISFYKLPLYENLAAK